MMDIRTIVASLVLYPLVIALSLVVIPWKYERRISRVIFFANLVNGALTASLFFLYASSGFKPVEISCGELFSVGDYHFNLMLLIDHYSVAFQTLIGILVGFVLVFSQRYMHREVGYLRFFASLFLFVSGISTVALAATPDMLFAGWEIVGVSSFLLIGFYRIRLQPGRNSIRTYAIYRFCDVGLFMGAWLFHKLGNEYFFLQYADKPLDPGLVYLHQPFFMVFGLLILLAAMGKSAQYPFSFWVPRAMEGPTPSSAIFYGALSIHAGVYLLIRMYPVWRAIDFIPWLVGAVGLFTALSANIALKTQSNIKGQIGYASVSQVGLMFFELALGLKEVAMIHFLGNAALRCYQLLASPSIMVLYLRQQAEGEVLTAGFSGPITRIFGEKIRRRIFAYSLSEGYSELILSTIWNILKAVARGCAKIYSPTIVLVLVLALFIVATFGKEYVNGDLNFIAAMIFGVAAVFMALVALGQSIDPERILWLTGKSAIFKGLSVVYLNPEHPSYSLLYFFGIAGGFVIAWFALRYIPRDLRKKEYAGAAELHPYAINFFLVGLLWMAGFTLSPTFFGDDILLHFGAEKYAVETLFIGGAFILSAVTLFRSYVKLAFAR